MEQRVMKLGRGLVARAWRSVGKARGVMLLETITAVAVFSMVGTAVMLGLNTTYDTGERTEAQSTAETVARNQMEYVFSQAYSAPGGTAYDTIAAPVGYGVAVTHEDVDPASPNPDIEKITVTVSRDSVDLLVLETYRFTD